MRALRCSQWSASAYQLVQHPHLGIARPRKWLLTRAATRSKVTVPYFRPGQRDQGDRTATSESKQSSEPQTSGTDGRDVDSEQYQRIQARIDARKPKKTQEEIEHEEEMRREDERFRSRPDTTMTEREQDTFQRLFKLIQRNRSNAQTAAGGESNEPGEDDMRAAEEAIDRGIGEELDDLEAEETKPEQKKTPSESPQITAYPGPLREMARKTQELEVKKKRKPKRHFSKSYEQIVSTTRPIVRRMQAAKTDVQIWDILETELFLKVRALHLDSPVEAAQAPSTRSLSSVPTESSRALASASDKAGLTNHSTGSIPSTPQDRSTEAADASWNLMIFSRVYQRAVLHAAKLLCGRTSYTPLAFALLSAIKALGPSSYAMGISPGLFNELLAHHWRVQNSMTPVLAMLAEMDRMACAMDSQTVALLSEILVYRSRAEYGQYGQAVRQLEMQPNRKRQGRELLEWKRRIQFRLEEDKKEELKRREQTRTLRIEGVLGEEELDDAPIATASAG